MLTKFPKTLDNEPITIGDEVFFLHFDQVHRTIVTAIYTDGTAMFEHPRAKIDYVYKSERLLYSSLLDRAQSRVDRLQHALAELDEKGTCSATIGDSA